jgi:hypothetical protein
MTFEHEGVKYWVKFSPRGAVVSMQRQVSRTLAGRKSLHWRRISWSSDQFDKIATVARQLQVESVGQ